MNRDANRARLLGDGTVDGLTDPPGGVCAEFESAPGVELADGAKQAQVALLN